VRPAGFTLTDQVLLAIARHNPPTIAVVLDAAEPSCKCSLLALAFSAQVKARY
jgi:hypothetical protein